MSRQTKQLRHKLSRSKIAARAPRQPAGFSAHYTAHMAFVHQWWNSRTITPTQRESEHVRLQDDRTRASGPSARVLFQRSRADVSLLALGGIEQCCSNVGTGNPAQAKHCLCEEGRLRV